MHMADALISPPVGGTMWAVTAGITALSARRLRAIGDDRLVALMGALGAFVFAAQMINFAIPGTGSSGHIAGGLLLAILLGPHAAFITIASILVVQALFFADGGLLALGCNVFNMAFYACFVAYPLVYRRLVGTRPAPGRILFAATIGSVVSLVMGASSVVLETILSGVSDLPFQTFALLMVPIHTAIGLVEGSLTAAVVIFLWRTRPEVLHPGFHATLGRGKGVKKAAVAILLLAGITGGILSWFASSQPDGLEWSLFRAAGKGERPSPRQGVYGLMERIQGRSAILPDYDFRASKHGQPEDQAPPEQSSWPSASPGTALSGVVGSVLTALLVGLIGIGLKRYHGRR